MEKTKKFGRLRSSLIAVLAAGAFWSLLGLSGALQKFEYRIYDALLLSRPVREKVDNLAMVEIDDASLDRLGPWPWSRDILADTLLSLKELGAKTAVFDIEYLSPSKLAVNPDDAEYLKENLNTSRAPRIAEYIFRDNDALFEKAIQFFGDTYLTINTEQISQVSAEDDGYARSRFLLNNVLDENNLIQKSNKRNRRHNADLSGTEAGFTPAIHRFIKMAGGAGFTNIIVDKDGTRRRIEPLSAQKGGMLAQLVIAPLLKELDVQSMTREKRALVLHGAAGKNGGRHDIRIPLDADGDMLIHWAPGNYADSFKHESVMIIRQLRECEDALVNNISEFKRIALTDAEGNPLSYSAEIESILEDYEYIENFRNYLFDMCLGYDENSVAEKNPLSAGEDFSALQASYFASREEFFARVQAFCSGSYRDEIERAIRNLSATELIGSGDAAALGEFFSRAFDGVQSQAGLYLSTFASLKADLEDAFCIIGNIASGSTDLGSTPFRNFFPNVGTHANVYNTIVTGDFITPLPSYWGIFFAVAAFALFAPLTHRARLRTQNIAAGSIVGVTAIAAILLMAVGGIYVPLVVPILTELSAAALIMLLRFATNEKERQLIKSTFGAYVAPEVVEQIIANPKYAQVGGDNKELTALFSDVQKFSKFTEIINNINGEERGAEQLVAALNNYLGALSDAIQEQRGTIDKYVGDEIVSFFGAPIEDSDHAFHSCAAAIRMLEAEAKINKKFFREFKYKECAARPWKEVAASQKWDEDRIKEYQAYVEEYNAAGFLPMELRSRVGLNSGRMVVGNMGTEKKLNYTIMGNNVNLASRLEGTNKVYGSWIMCSESTHNLVMQSAHKDELLFRNFDAVRVINVERPVRIYNVLGFKAELPSEQIEAASLFNKGMIFYMNGSERESYKKPPAELEEALKFFEKASRLYPQDASSAHFAERCKAFLNQGIPEIWDGVYTMETK